MTMLDNDILLPSKNVTYDLNNLLTDVGVVLEWTYKFLVPYSFLIRKLCYYCIDFSQKSYAE